MLLHLFLFLVLSDSVMLALVFQPSSCKCSTKLHYFLNNHDFCIDADHQSGIHYHFGHVVSEYVEYVYIILTIYYVRNINNLIWLSHNLFSQWFHVNSLLALFNNCTLLLWHHNFIIYH